MRNHKLSVMQIILNLERTGAQEVVRTLAEYLQANDCTVMVCTFRDGPMRAEIEKLGVKVEILQRPLLSDLLRTQAMGQVAKQQVAAHFSVQKQADGHLALYHRLLNR